MLSRALLLTAFGFSVTLGGYFVSTHALPQTSTYKVEALGVSGKQLLSADGQDIFESEGSIRNTREVSFEKSSRKVLMWDTVTPDGTKPYFSLYQNGRWQAAQALQSSLMLRSGKVSLGPNVSLTGDALFKRNASSSLHVVQFATQLLPEIKSEMEAMGVKLIKYMPFNAFLVKLSPAQKSKISGMSYVRWVGAFEPVHKLEADLKARIAVDVDSESNSKYKVIVVPLEDSQKETAMKQVQLLGGRVISPVPGSILFVAEVTPSQSTILAQSDAVLWMQKWTPTGVDMNNARVVGGANAVESQLPQFTGLGISGHVMEGANAVHPDFAATATRKAPISVWDGRPDWHGNATYGIVFGSGKTNAKAKGMLPDAQGLYTNRDAVFDAEPGPANPKSRYSLVKELINTHHVMFQTASWGHQVTTEYEARSAEMDRIIFDLDIPITQSQSNMGSRKSRPQAWAKNIISVGALYHFDNTDPADDAWNSGGSIGPATDGRMKPDLMAFYDKIETTDINGHMLDFGGTSGATPIVAGHLGLTLQMWSEGLFGNPVQPGVEKFFNRPHFTTAKALLIATAKQYAFNGANVDKSRAKQGWGFPNLKDMYERRDRLYVVNETDILTVGLSKQYNVEVAAGETELKVTMIYAEPEATLPSSVTRLNNLNLKITAPDGTIYWGNNGLAQGNYSTAGGQANLVDPVENVILKAPVAGSWKVEVIAEEVNVDTHVETPALDADYALVINGGKTTAL